jgi:hypothetical protein
VTVGVLSAAFLFDSVPSSAVSLALLLELGFEIADTVWSLWGLPWLGLHSAPLYIHHAVSVALELLLLDVLLEQGIVAPPHVARILIVEVGSGGIDLLCNKVLPRVGLRPHTAPQWIVATLYALWFVSVRVVLFVVSISGVLGLMSSATPKLLWV